MTHQSKRWVAPPTLFGIPRATDYPAPNPAFGKKNGDRGSSVASESSDAGDASSLETGSPLSMLFDRRNLVPFLAAATMGIPVNLVGTFRLGELLILALYPFYVRLILKALRNREVAFLLTLGVLWFSSQLISDLYNGTPASKYARGWANILLTILNLLFYCGLYARSPKQHVGTLLGATAGGVFGAYYLYFFGDKSLVNKDHLWDFYVTGWAYPGFGLIAFLFFRRAPWLVIGVGLIYGILGNLLGGRSDGLIALTSTMLFVYLWWALLILGKNPQHLLRNGIALATVLLVPFFILYVSFAQSGQLGRAAKVQIDLAKNPYNPIEVLLLARNESIIALDAIYEKPILGHGSWANPPHLRRLYLLKMREIYGKRAPRRVAHDVLPVHSVLLGAWVFSGLAGFLFWVYVIYRTVFLSNVLFRQGTVWVIAIVVVYLPFFGWHVMFSPHSFARFVWPMGMAFLIFSSLAKTTRVGEPRI